MKKSAIERLPQELLLYIFQAVVPPIYQHDPSIVHGPHSPWMSALRTRKALALSCKAFFGPATEVLYQDIVLRRMGQIPALARTLDPARTPSADNIAALVRSIRMDSCVVWAPFADVVREELHLILRHCAALRAFSFHPHVNFAFREGPDSDLFDAFDPTWLFSPDCSEASPSGLLYASLAHGLSVMDLYMDLRKEADFLAFHALLAGASRVTKLKIRLNGLCVIEPEPLPGPVRPLLALEDFYYDCQTYCGWFFQYISHAWDLPRLRALTVIDQSAEAVDEFLHAHGAGLTYLHWRNQYLEIAPPYSELAALGSNCPRLEHLVIQHSIPNRRRRIPPLPTVRSPTLRFLDVWTLDVDPLRRDALPALISPDSDTPSLERVRVLLTPFTDFDQHPPTVDWPRLCHPLDTGSEEHKPWCLPAARVGPTARVAFFEDTQCGGLHGQPGHWHADHALDVELEQLAVGELREPDEEEDVTFVLSDESFDLDGTGADEELEGDGDDIDLPGRGPVIAGSRVDREVFLAMFHENQLAPPFLFEDGV
ncbi:uncharacterized protein TRAVEDRAFT_51619 [Trametes versicolor FP-101664 SS1]|uniref:uncharacterized protein n=1 Tax=Trametes versicolor (strain FP-101664) TaxID=717944 RepID=UPI0004623948|nr:uncharacterized protein TRAVEDRAFT_51619 [Trametes versicolor FP-101664 SS1]EIW53875.1 hypothetical protein TRAVEDRAFT_51619 [Trametes versicolor FP-101664 SS1]